jgi:hypothetical protein
MNRLPVDSHMAAEMEADIDIPHLMTTGRNPEACDGLAYRCGETDTDLRPWWHLRMTRRKWWQLSIRSPYIRSRQGY